MNDGQQAVTEKGATIESEPVEGRSRRRLYACDLESLVLRCGEVEVDLTDEVTQWQYAVIPSRREPRLRAAAVIHEGGPVLQALVDADAPEQPVTAIIELAKGAGRHEITGHVAEYGIAAVGRHEIQEFLELRVEQVPLPTNRWAERWWVEYAVPCRSQPQPLSVPGRFVAGGGECPKA